ncbi:pro-adrenomedullin [Cavia porcellus]|uniref:Pro-adrenomedullin n=1 Tax=Cavia porcellus TaxID=10141 RepID=A0A286XAC8_CAVPO|nr:ADM [Cavia porcellus]
MKLVSVALMFLGSLAFLGTDAAQLDGASETLKKWSKWTVSRGKRELPVPSSNFPGLENAKAGSVQRALGPQNLESLSRIRQASGPKIVLNRVKRHRQGFRSFGCRFGTCTVQKLAHQIYQLTDKDKDGVAPRSKISPQGYGRRRRRSLLETRQDRTLVSSQPQARVASGSKVHRVLATLRRI